MGYLTSSEGYRHFDLMFFSQKFFGAADAQIQIVLADIGADAKLFKNALLTLIGRFFPFLFVEKLLKVNDFDNGWVGFFRDLHQCLPQLTRFF